MKQNVCTVSFHPFLQESQNDFVRRNLRDVLNQVKERMQCNPNNYTIEHTASIFRIGHLVRVYSIETFERSQDIEQN